MVAAGSFKTLVATYKSIWCHNAEEHNINFHHCISIPTTVTIITPLPPHLNDLVLSLAYPFKQHRKSTRWHKLQSYSSSMGITATHKHIQSYDSSGLRRVCNQQLILCNRNYTSKRYYKPFLTHFAGTLICLTIQICHQTIRLQCENSRKLTKCIILKKLLLKTG
jgi:hypothetical protein